MAAVTARKDLLKKVYKMVPPMLEHFHKGQLGRVAVVGGSEDYTGAPYFSAMASAKLGCDLSHVICTPSAGAVIKTYSPILMVHPYMRQSPSQTTSSSNSGASNSKDPDDPKNDPDEPILSMLPRLHTLVIGPGLGRDPLMHKTCARIITAARSQNLPFILDADGLLLASTQPDLVKGYKECILTPNVVEFGRLADAMGLDVKGGDKTKLCEELAKRFGGVTIVQKGGADYISNGSVTLVSEGEGGLKRAGGQGDTLTGCLATLLAWRSAYHDGLWDGEGQLPGAGPGAAEGTARKEDGKMSREETMGLAAYGGSAITRECSRRAFKKLGRSMQAGDLTEHVHGAFLELVGEPSEAVIARM